ncbi:MAG TPA: hypothetical protein VFV01_47995 [Spirillospora sp.]|nr:hypothetical protein [Spirillospora sp.]
MRYGRSFKVLVVQEWEVDELPTDLDSDDLRAADQWLCDNGRLVHEDEELLDDDELDCWPLDDPVPFRVVEDVVSPLLCDPASPVSPAHRPPSDSRWAEEGNEDEPVT